MKIETTTALAKKLGVNQSTVSRWMKHNPVLPHSTGRLCYIFDTDLVKKWLKNRGGRFETLSSRI